MQLLTCPFCDSAAKMSHTSGKETWWVTCASTDCNAEGPTGDTEMHAANRWNRAVRPEENVLDCDKRDAIAARLRAVADELDALVTGVAK